MKQQRIRQNTTVRPDGFGTWGVVNYSEESVATINNYFKLLPGESFEFTVDPGCEWGDDILIEFAGDSSASNLILYRMYNRETE